MKTMRFATGVRMFLLVWRLLAFVAGLDQT